MIPKKIHYFWFGRGEKPALVEHCIESWKRVQPDFEIIEWNDDNFDVNQIPFSAQAYKNKKWAFVSDYARAKILYTYGGFYLDTDMELRLPLNGFLEHHAICGFEMRGVPYSAFFAVEPNHILAQDICRHYENLKNFEETPNTKIFSELLVTKYGADANNDRYQKLMHGVELYPSEYFSLDLPKNYITHHFSGSWHGAWEAENNSFKSFVNTYGIIKLFSEIPNARKEIKNLVYNHKIISPDEILDQIPIRYILAYLQKKLKSRFKL